MKSAVQKHSAFTLVELMIVVAVLGILAALVFPEVQGYSQRAKEAAAKENLRILRDAIERYALDHNGIPPGYPGNDTTLVPHFAFLKYQLLENPDKKYLSVIPKNPFSEMVTIRVYSNSSEMPASPELPYMFGWFYKPSTKTIRLNWPGKDSKGINYYDY